eukprot:g1908.t1
MPRQELAKLLNTWSERLVRLPQATEIEVLSFKGDAVEGVETVTSAIDACHRSIYRCRHLGVVSAEELAVLSRSSMFLQDVSALYRSTLRGADGVLVVIDASKHEVPQWVCNMLRDIFKQDEEMSFEECVGADTWIVANRMDQLPEFFCKEGKEFSKKVMERQHDAWHRSGHVIPIAARLSSLAIYGKEKIQETLSAQLLSRLERQAWFAQACALLFGIRWIEQVKDVDQTRWRSSMRELMLLGQVTGPLANSVLKTAYVKMLPRSVTRAMQELSQLTMSFCSALSSLEGSDSHIEARVSSHARSIPEDRDLFHAAMHNDVRTVKTVLQHGVPMPSTADKLLLVSAARDRWKTVDLMMDHGCASRARATLTGVRCGSKMKDIIQSTGRTTEEVSSSTTRCGEGALQIAASRGNWREVVKLLETGVDLTSDAAIGAFGLAAKTNRPERRFEVLERCLALGMTLDTWGGHKAFLDAAAGGHVEVLKVLVSHGASLSSWVAQEAVRCAIEKERKEVLHFLVQSGFDVTGELGDLLLENAAARNDICLMQLLLNKGADFRWMGEAALSSSGRCSSWEPATGPAEVDLIFIRLIALPTTGSFNFLDMINLRPKAFEQLCREGWLQRVIRGGPAGSMGLEVGWQVAFLAALEKRHLFSLQVLEDQGFNFCSERSELTLAQANLEDPQIRQFVEEARARRAEKDSAEVAQTLVEHLEERQTVRLARALAAQISFRDDPVAVTLAQQLLSNDPFQRNAAIALAQDLLGGGRDSRCSSARTAPLSSAGEVSVAASDEAEALANRVFAQLKETEPAALADFLLVSRALAEHEPEALESDPPPVPDDLEMEMQDRVLNIEWMKEGRTNTEFLEAVGLNTAPLLLTARRARASSLALNTSNVAFGASVTADSLQLTFAAPELQSGYEAPASRMFRWISLAILATAMSSKLSQQDGILKLLAQPSGTSKVKAKTSQMEDGCDEQGATSGIAVGRCFTGFGGGYGLAPCSASEGSAGGLQEGG